MDEPVNVVKDEKIGPAAYTKLNLRPLLGLKIHTLPSPFCGLSRANLTESHSTDK